MQGLWYKLQMKLDCYKNVSICLADSEAVFMSMHLLLMIQGEPSWGDNFYFPCYQLERPVPVRKKRLPVDGAVETRLCAASSQ